MATLMPALVAWLHHIAAFTLVASLVVESVLIRDPLTLASARRLQLADLCFGSSAAAAIVMLGMVRVFYLEKGAHSHYYFHSAPFIGKLCLHQMRWTAQGANRLLHLRVADLNGVLRDYVGAYAKRRSPAKDSRVAAVA
jgi:hypothetical protein